MNIYWFDCSKQNSLRRSTVRGIEAYHDAMTVAVEQSWLQDVSVFQRFFYSKLQDGKRKQCVIFRAPKMLLSATSKHWHLDKWPWEEAMAADRPL